MAAWSRGRRSAAEVRDGVSASPRSRRSRAGRRCDRRLVGMGTRSFVSCRRTARPQAVKRGEIWWARLPLPAGRRPVVLVSRDDAYAVRLKVTVAEISTVVRAIPTEVSLGRSDGMPRTCVINTDNLVTIAKTYLEAKIATLRDARVAEL